MYSNKLKLTTLGTSSTGKTSIVNRFISGQFDHYATTVGASYLMCFNDDIKYEIWDTAGNERFFSLLPLYYRGSDIILLVFDLANLETIDNLTYFLNELSKNMSTECRIIVVGNKLDLIPDGDSTKANIIVKGLLKDRETPKISDFVYVSTKDGSNFEELKNIVFKHGEEIRLRKEKMGAITYPLVLTDAEKSDKSKCTYC